MRVIAGTARGTKLNSLPGEEVTRPTIDRVKEAVFSSLQFLLPGARVLDLFAGSGQLGIEALSRGAAGCVFVDQNQDAINVISGNCRAAGVFDRSRITHAESVSFLANTRFKFDIVLLDPPYNQGTLAQILPRIAQVTNEGGTVICESERGAQLPESCEGLQLKKQHCYGKVMVTRYEKGETV